MVGKVGGRAEPWMAQPRERVGRAQLAIGWIHPLGLGSLPQVPWICISNFAVQSPIALLGWLLCDMGFVTLIN